jgi:hypothetical protein
MPRNEHESTLGLELLRRVVAAGKSGWFQLAEVAPREMARFVGPLTNLVDRGFVERVTEGCGRWHYRLTAAGLHAVRIGRLPQPDSYPGRMSEVEPTPTDTAAGRGRRVDRRDARKWQ